VTPRNRDPLGVRAFRALLALYPAAFRDEYRRELLMAFVDRDRGTAGAWDRARLWLEALAGVMVEAPKEHARMLLQDLRYGWRVLRQHALVTTTIVVTLGLGIGLNTAMFSLLNAIVMRSLPLHGAGDLYSVNLGDRVVTGPESARLSGPMLERLIQAAPEGVTVAAMSRGVAKVHTRLGDGSGTAPAALQLVSGAYFAALGAPPVMGRAVGARGGQGGLEDDSGVVISHSYWQRRFGGASDVVGRALTINGAPFTVLGVGPPDFAGAWLELPVDLWAPLTAQAAVKYAQDYTADNADPNRPWLSQPNIWWLHVVVRAPRETVAATRGAFDATMTDLLKRDAGLVLDPFTRGFSRLRREFRFPLYALSAMAALVLLVACANVANLLLARSAERQREIAVRLALGAGRGRLVHQLLTESALLVVLAGVLSLVVASWAADGLARMATATVDSGAPFAVGIDLRVLAFTAAVACASVLVFGVVPARQAARVDLLGALRAGARGSVGWIARGPARALVVAQVALSLVLVTATGLVVRSFQNVGQVELGFEPDRLLSVTMDPRLSDVAPEAYAGLYARALSAARGVAGVESAALAMCGIQSGCRAREDGYEIEGYRPRPNEVVMFVVNAVGPDYFSTVGMRMIAGRPLNGTDIGGGQKVAVVNRTLAETYFPNGEAVGKRFGQSGPDTEIVGIVDDARVLGLTAAPAATVFFPLAQRGVISRSLEVRTSGAPEQAAGALRSALTRSVPELPVESIAPMSERVERAMSPWRLILMMTSGFGTLALGLAAFGLFGVLANAVARRTPEFGVRMALGASRSTVVAGVVREALWLVAVGLAVGLPVVLIGGRFISTLLFGVSPFDRVSVVAATLVLFGVGGLCSAVPALRASRVDPNIALRQE
jgi:predicted permease